MSRNEDYLDNLLTSVTTKLNEFDDDFEQSRDTLRQSYRTQSDLPRRTQRALDEMREDNFLREFENDLNMDEDDEFLREFEREMDLGGDGSVDDDFVNTLDLSDDDRSPNPSGEDPDLDRILGEAADAAQEADTMIKPLDDFEQPDAELPEVPKGMEGLEDLFSDSDSSPKPEPQPVQEKPQEPPVDMDMDLDQILNESDDEAIDQIKDMMEGGSTEEPAQEELDLDSSEADFPFEDAIPREEDIPKPKKERNPNSLFARIARVLFGTPEELDPQAAAEYAAAHPEENLDPAAAKEKKKQEKELKKQQKKEAAEQKKKEKEEAKAAKAAEKAAKPKKEKKPKEKKPQEPKEPALPKVPVAMMWILALSFMVLILLGTSLVDYTTGVNQAKEAFDSGDYVAAYTTLDGLKLKQVDEELYHKAAALAGIQTELDSYTALMEQKQYALALDALIRGMGRCTIHSADAEEWGVSDQLAVLRKQIRKLLNEQFDVSAKKAKKLYNIKKRRDYTLELEKILDKLGLAYM